MTSIGSEVLLKLEQPTRSGCTFSEIYSGTAGSCNVGVWVDEYNRPGIDAENGSVFGVVALASRRDHSATVYGTFDEGFAHKDPVGRRDLLSQVAGEAVLQLQIKQRPAATES